MTDDKDKYGMPRENELLVTDYSVISNTRVTYTSKLIWTDEND